MKHLRKNTSAKKCIVLSTNTFDSGYAVWKWMQELLRFKFTPWNGWMFELYRARRLKSLTQWAPVLALSRGSSSSSAAKGSPRTFSCLLAKVLVEAKKFAAPFFKVLLVCPHHGVDISQGLTQLPQVANCVFPCSQSAMRPVGRALPLLRASNDLMAVSRSALSTDRKHSRCSMRSKLSSAASAAVMAGRWHTRRRQRTARRGFARRSSLCTVSIQIPASQALCTLASLSCVAWPDASAGSVGVASEIKSHSVGEAEVTEPARAALGGRADSKVSAGCLSWVTARRSTGTKFDSLMQVRLQARHSGLMFHKVHGNTQHSQSPKSKTGNKDGKEKRDRSSAVSRAPKPKPTRRRTKLNQPKGFHQPRWHRAWAFANVKSQLHSQNDAKIQSSSN